MIDAENKYHLQSTLQQLNADAQNMANNANQTQFQTTYASRLGELRTNWAKMVSSFEPQEAALIRDIGGALFFLDDIPGDIDRTARENPHTPAITQQLIQATATKRDNYLTNIRQLRDRLKEIGVTGSDLTPGSAEIGLLIPRTLFHNMFDELVKELATINRIVRAFSEVATGSAERVELRQISTSDPTFFLSLSVETAKLIGGAVTWALATWAAVEGIRKLRSETQKNKSFTDEEIREFFETKVEKTIQMAIEEKLTAVLGAPTPEAGRAKEQRTDLAWALSSVLTRVERGMTVELRFLPPVQIQDEKGVPIPEAPVFQELREIVPQLSFPPADPSPILQLPPSEPPSQAGRAV